MLLKAKLKKNKLMLLDLSCKIKNRNLKDEKNSVIKHQQRKYVNRITEPFHRDNTMRFGFQNKLETRRVATLSQRQAMRQHPFELLNYVNQRTVVNIRWTVNSRKHHNSRKRRTNNRYRVMEDVRCLIVKLITFNQESSLDLNSQKCAIIR